MHTLLQRTLDLFAPEPAPAPIPVPASVLTPEPVDTRPTQSLQEALAPATYRHPEANREALLDGVLVAYAFKRGKRRTIGFSVGAEGLAVSAPKWVLLNEIDRAVQEKAGWIVKKLQETRERHKRLEAVRIDWKDGATLPFLGGVLTVVLDPRQSVSAMMVQPVSAVADAVHAAKGLPPTDEHNTLCLGLAHSATATQIRDAAQAWLMRYARQLFEQRLNHFAPELGVQWRRLSLSSAGTRWGSASADGSIRLNWRLIHFKLSVIDYVVVHELSHLRVMDHSPRFWDTVRHVVPDYAELRSQLKDEMVPKW